VEYTLGNENIMEECDKQVRKFKSAILQGKSNDKRQVLALKLKAESFNFSASSLN